jgi:hypothetical protein
MLCFSHPCGIGYAMVGMDDDNRRPYSHGNVPAEFGIRGTHGITVSLRDAESSDEFMQYGWSGKHRRVDGSCIRFEVGSGGSGCIVNFLLEPRVLFIIVHSKWKISTYKATSNFASRDLASPTRLIAKTVDILIRFMCGRPREHYSRQPYLNPRAF